MQSYLPLSFKIIFGEAYFAWLFHFNDDDDDDGASKTKRIPCVSHAKTSSKISRRFAYAGGSDGKCILCTQANPASSCIHIILIDYIFASCYPPPVLSLREYAPSQLKHTRNSIAFSIPSSLASSELRNFGLCWNVHRTHSRQTCTRFQLAASSAETNGEYVCKL